MRPDAPATGEAPNNSVDPGSALAPEVADGKRWVVVAGGRVPDGIGKRNVLVVQSSGPAVRDAEGKVKEPGKVKTTGYPTGADLYLRTDQTVEFPADAKVITIGDNARIGGVGGLTRSGGLRSGPSLAYAGLSLAYQHGGEDIVISGLTKAEQERLQPWLDSPKMPGDVKVSFA